MKRLLLSQCNEGKRKTSPCSPPCCNTVTTAAIRIASSTQMPWRSSPVQAGDELTCFYPASEWKMAQAFDCCCGAAGCLRKIEGAYCLPETLLAQYRLTAFIRKQVQARRRNL